MPGRPPHAITCIRMGGGARQHGQFQQSPAGMGRGAVQAGREGADTQAEHLCMPHTAGREPGATTRDTCRHRAGSRSEPGPNLLAPSTQHPAPSTQHPARVRLCRAAQAGQRVGIGSWAQAGSRPQPTWRPACTASAAAASRSQQAPCTTCLTLGTSPPPLSSSAAAVHPCSHCLACTDCDASCCTAPANSAAEASLCSAAISTNACVHICTGAPRGAGGLGQARAGSGARRCRAAPSATQPALTWVQPGGR